MRKRKPVDKPTQQGGSKYLSPRSASFSSQLMQQTLHANLSVK